MIEREVAAWLLNVFSVHKLAPQTMYVRKEFFPPIDYLDRHCLSLSPKNGLRCNCGAPQGRCAHVGREAFAQAGREERKLLDARTASVVRALSHTTPPLFREAQSWTRRVGRNRLGGTMRRLALLAETIASSLPRLASAIPVTKSLSRGGSRRTRRRLTRS